MLKVTKYFEIDIATQKRNFVDCIYIYQLKRS